MTTIGNLITAGMRLYANRDEVQALVDRAKPWGAVAGALWGLAQSDSDLPGRVMALIKQIAPDLAAAAPPAYDAEWVQNSLNELGWHLHVDGVIGDATTDAIKEFQTKYSLAKVDGLAGFKTCSTLFILVEQRRRAMTPG